jgi:hypothetical protein
MSLPWVRVGASITNFGLMHITVGRRDSKSMVLAAGFISEPCIHNDLCNIQNY